MEHQSAWRRHDIVCSSLPPALHIAANLPHRLELPVADRRRKSLGSSLCLSTRFFESPPAGAAGRASRDLTDQGL